MPFGLTASEASPSQIQDGPVAPGSAPGAPDPSVIARMANAFFQMTPNQTTPGGDPGLPVFPPSPAMIPAPNLVTSVAPFTPANPLVGPPDLPPSTIPSLVPTPNLTAPHAPSVSTMPPGYGEPPMPGASAGSVGPSGAPFGLGESAQLVPEAHRANPFEGVPGAPASNKGAYFLAETAYAQAPTASAPAPALPQVPAAPAPQSGFAPSADAAASAAPSTHAIPSAAQAPNVPGIPGAPSGYSALPDATAGFAAPGSIFDPAEAARLNPDSRHGAVSDAPGAAYFLTDAPYSKAPAAPTSVPGVADIPTSAPATAPTGGASPNSSGVAPNGVAPRATYNFLELDLRPIIAPTRGAVGFPLDPEAIKRDFPILQERVNGGKRLIWLDNAATTQKPLCVIDRISDFYKHENSNIHRAAHALAARATDAYEAAREKTRRFLNAPSAKDIVFVRGTTEGINFIAQSWGRANVKEGDEILVSHLEHHANIVPWQQLCAQTGARLVVAPVDDSGQIILEAYEKLLGPKTKIVSVTQVSNALGTVTPVTEMTALAHQHGICVVVDGAQAVSHMPVDVQAIGCDFYVFSGHKVFGPTGIGAVYGRDAVLAQTPPWQGGGNMIADVTFEKTVFQAPPDRFEAGTGNIADAVGLGAALDYVEQLGMANIGAYEHGLLEYATAKMLAVPGLRMIGTAREKASVLSFVLAGKETTEVGKALDAEGIAVRSGHHCAQPILRRFGLEATVRPSLAFYNTCEDVDAMVDVLFKLQGRN
jgi:cysteine desulfurase/selenocysteine lyase